RAAGVTIRDAAVHAARRLVARLLLRQRNHELAPVAHALLDRRIVAVVALELEEAGDLAHLTRSCFGPSPSYGALWVDWRTDPRPAERTVVIRPPASQRPCPWRARRAPGGTRPASPCGISAGSRSSARGCARPGASRQSAHDARSGDAGAPRRSASGRSARRRGRACRDRRRGRTRAR